MEDMAFLVLEDLEEEEMQETMILNLIKDKAFNSFQVKDMLFHDQNKSFIHLFRLHILQDLLDENILFFLSDASFCQDNHDQNVLP